MVVGKCRADLKDVQFLAQELYGLDFRECPADPLTFDVLVTVLVLFTPFQSTLECVLIVPGPKDDKRMIASIELPRFAVIDKINDEESYAVVVHRHGRSVAS